MKLGHLAVVTPGISTTSRGAGARAGDWRLEVVESADIEDDRLRFRKPRAIEIERNARTEKHLLRPHDVLVTARSQSVKVALVPPSVSRTVAASTLLVVRALTPETGAAHFLWYYLTSTRGRAALEGQVRVGASIPSLPASALAEIDVPLPPLRELHLLANLVEESERAYEAAVRAAVLRRQMLRDAVIGDLARRPDLPKENPCR